jgi:hypothetical protein
MCPIPCAPKIMVLYVLSTLTSIAPQMIKTDEVIVITTYVVKGITAGVVTV